MAQSAGDLLIRIAADFAELNTALGEIGGKLDAFGNKVNAHNSKMQGMFSSLVTAAKAFVGALAIREVYEYGKAIEEAVGNMADMADNLKMGIDDFQAFTNAAYLAGQKTEAVSTAIGKFNVFMGKASEGSKEQIDRLNEMGIKILDVNGGLIPQAELLSKVAKHLIEMKDGASRAAMEVAFFGKSGQAVSAILEQWAKGTAQLNKELEAQGLRHTPEVIKQLDALSDRSEKAAKQVEVLFAALYAPVKTFLFEKVANGLTFIANAVNLLDPSRLASWERLARIMVGFMTMSPRTMFGELNDVPNKLLGEASALEASINKAEANIAKLKANSQSVTGTTLEIEENRLVKYKADLEKVVSQWTKLTGGMGPNKPLETPETPGKSNPAVKGAGDSFLEEIAKLDGQTKAAKEAFNEYAASNRDKGLEFIKADIEKEKKLADMVAAFSAKKDSAPYLEQFKKAASDFVAIDAGLKEQGQLFAKGEADAAKYGNGVNALSLRQKELSRELKAGRINQDEFNSAMKDADEIARSQANAYGRMKGGIDGFTAGIDSAAQAFEKANDAFSMGQQVFTGFTNALSEGMDALSGKSKKTFGDIASDFAAMLSKMALQAAMSQVFKYIFGAVGFGTPTATGPVFGPPAPASSGNRAAGGDVFGASSYMVGEHGPERFTPSVSGNITPFKSSGSDGGVTVNLALGGTSGTTSPTAALEFGKKIKAAVTDVLMIERRPGGLLYGGR